MNKRGASQIQKGRETKSCDSSTPDEIQTPTLLPLGGDYDSEILLEAKGKSQPEKWEREVGKEALRWSWFPYYC